MGKEVLFKDKQLVIEVEGPILIQTWTGFIPSKQLREGLTKAHDLFISNKLKYQIVDVKDAGVVNKEDNEWLSTTIIPNLQKNGLKGTAMIFPREVFAQVSLNNLMKKVTVEDHRFFDDISSAKEWIESLENN